MRSVLLVYLLNLFLCGWCAPLSADVLVTSAVLDNTLYESPTGAFSNGVGDFLFTGRVDAGGNRLLRRALVAFDLSAIPSGSIVTSASLRLGMNRSVQIGATSVSLHRMTRLWGEGTSNANGQEGTGAASTNGDATWIHSSFSGTNWTTAGGDFINTASATEVLNANGNYTWGSNASMVADVQQWVNNSSNNFGWILLGDESNANLATALRFLSRTGTESATNFNRPQLTVEFSAVPEPTSGLLVVASAGLFGLRKWRQSRAKVLCR